jgi:hypothetical protein
MKKYVITICIIFCIISITSVPVISANVHQFIINQVDYRILINEEHVDFNSPLITVDNRLYVSLRELSEFLGYEVLWNGERGEVSLKSEELTEKMFYTSFEGILSSGVKYKFHGKDEDVFNFNEFRERYQYKQKRRVDAILIARTPAEAAELGQFYLNPGLRNLQPGQFARGYEEDPYTFSLRYCSETDNWVLQLVFSEGVIATGVPGVLAVNRSNGTMVTHHRTPEVFDNPPPTN